MTLSGTRAEALEQLKASLGERAHVVAAKMDDAADIDRLAKEAEAAMGKLDILVNNAGITRDNISMRMKDEEWEKVLQVNLTGTFRLTRAAMRGMMRRRFGRVINITSIVGVTGNPGQANYAAAKAGLIGMSKSLAQELASRSITVNCVAPGFIATPMTDALTDDQKKGILGRVPGRPAGHARRDRGRRGLSGERRGGLCHRPDPAHQRRDGDDLTGQGCKCLILWAFRR